MSALRNRVRALLFTSVLAALGIGAQCSAPPAGLEVLVVTNLENPQQYDAVELDVSQQTGGKWTTILSNTFLVPAEVVLPTRFAIAPGTSSDQDALIAITAYKDYLSKTSPGTKMVLRVAQVQIPTDRVAELTLVLSADCIGVFCPDASQSCQPSTGMCGSNVIDPKTLPKYEPSDAEAIDVGPGFVDGGQDAIADQTVHDAPMDVNEACVPEALDKACGKQCAGTVTDNCGHRVACTPAVCGAGTTCNESNHLCETCVVDGNKVSAAADCGDCCSTSCSSGTTCCTSESLDKACANQCTGTVKDNCGKTVACASSVCKAGTTCDLGTGQCKACVPDGDKVSTSTDCGSCCSTSCSSGTTCCTSEPVAKACGKQCGGTVKDNCGKTVACTPSLCSLACDETTQRCVTSCVPDGDKVTSGADCVACCASSCSTGTTCCTPESLQLACGSQCAGPVKDNCGLTDTCTPAVCTTGTCDESTGLCATCVPDGDSVHTKGDCAGCCSASCKGSPTTCCTRKSVVAACGLSCSGKAPDGCGGTVDCATNPCPCGGSGQCVQCLLDSDCTPDGGLPDASAPPGPPDGSILDVAFFAYYDAAADAGIPPGPFCNATTNACVSCVAGGDTVSRTADCSRCCGGRCDMSTQTCCTRKTLYEACANDAGGFNCSGGIVSDGCGNFYNCAFGPC